MGTKGSFTLNITLAVLCAVCGTVGVCKVGHVTVM